MSSNRLRIAILGASGYSGGELVRLLSRHPRAEIVLMTADRNAGEPYGAVFPHLSGLDLPDLISLDSVEWPGLEVDVVFCALPHGTTQDVVAGILHQTGHDVVDELLRETPGDLAAEVPGQPRVIDISADFRLEDEAAYAEWYGHEHRAPHLQAEAVYGLTEFAREKLRKARLVACPGCYPTSALLPLTPLLAAGQIDAENIVIDAKSGVTGAGRGLKQTSLFGEVAEGISAYGIARHRHTPEIDQELAKIAGGPVTVTFTPHLTPMNRGILSTIYVRTTPNVGVDELRTTLAERYAGEPFVRVLPEGAAPSTHDVRGSNFCSIGVFADRQPGRAILVSAIDNMVKGASGQAVQNMNVMYGIEETTGLEQQPLFP